MQARQAIKEIRCTCGKMLAKVSVPSDSGFIEIKCQRCQKVNKFRIGSDRVEKPLTKGVN